MMSGLIGIIGDRYYILEQIGRGGMTTVYKALDLQTDRNVAIKVLAPFLVKDPRFSARFKREIEVLQQLNHPNIVPILAYGEHEGSPFIVMPHFPLGTLAHRLEQDSLPPREGAILIQQISSALDYAHQQGIIHRDIKPSNILIDDSGNAMLSDFGLARLSNASQDLTGSAIIGTPAYMSPEQCRGESIDDHSDQYSLGVVLYQLATGYLPYDGDTPMAVALKHINEPLPRPRDLNPNLPEPVEAVLVKALAKNPSLRYPSVSALNRAFQRALQISLAPSKRRMGWITPYDQITKVIKRVQRNSRAFFLKPSFTKSFVRALLIVLVIGLPLTVFAMIGKVRQDMMTELKATIAVLYTVNAPLGDAAQDLGPVHTAVAGTLIAFEQQSIADEGENAPFSNFFSALSGERELALAPATAFFEALSATSTHEAQATLTPTQSAGSPLPRSPEASNTQPSGPTPTSSGIDSPTPNPLETQTPTGVPSATVTSSPGTTGTASPTNDGTFSPTPTPTVDITNTNTPITPTTTMPPSATYTPSLTPSPEVTNTPAPTQPPPPTEDVCAKLSLGGFNAQAVRVKWTLSNSSGSSVTIGSIGVNWPTYNQSLKRVEVGGSTVWSGEDDQPPTPISGIGSSIPAGSAKEIIFTFKKAVATTGYRLDLGFNNGCSVSQSN